ncbi:hypothetical protein D3C84_824530 [compost metagenome]
MGDVELGLGFGQHRLRGNATGPEQRNLVGMHRHRVAVVRSGKVSDADQRRIPDMHRRTVGHGEARGNFDGTHGVGRFHRAHGHHRLARQASRRMSIDGGAVHGDVAAEFDMPQTDAGIQQRLFEGEGAADGEGDEVRLPEFADIGHFLERPPTAVDAITRHVAAHIDVGAELLEVRGTRFGDVQQRTGTRIEDAEAQELVCP